MENNNNIRSVFTINENAKPNILSEKVSVHVVYFENDTDCYSKGMNVISTSFSNACKKFEKMNIGRIFNATDNK